MYTRCSECGTVFRVTATVLQMAEGQVCCGNCGATFNALAALFDQPPDEGAAAAARSDPTHPEPDLPDPALDETLEFDVPEQEWSRFFFDTGAIPAPSAPRAVPALGADFDELPEPGSAAEAGDEDRAAEPGTPGEDSPAPQRETAATDEWEMLLEDAADEEQDGDEPMYIIGEEDETAAAVDEEPDVLIPVEHVALESADDEELPSQPPGPAALPGAESRAVTAGRAAPIRAVPESPGTVLEWGAAPGLLQTRAPQPRRVAGWFAGSLALGFLLAAQLVHYNRDTLAADMRYGWLVRMGYARLNLPLYPSWPLESYEIRGAEAIAGRTAAGALDVVAQIAVRGKQPVGLPMVRLVLRDRWSNAVGGRLLAPAEFLPEPQSPSRIYPPGAIIPVLISVADPGTAAQGYELDVCRPDRHRGLQCQSSGDPFRRSD